MSTPTKKAWWFPLAFWLWWVLLTIGLASGGLSVIRDGYYLISEKQPPKASFFTFVELCGMLAAWILWSKERRFRWRIEHPNFHPPANVQTVSGTVIRTQLLNGRY